MTQNTYVAEGPANFQWLDPQVSYYSYDYGIIQNVYETLLWWNGTNGVTPIPWLASNFTQVTPNQYIIGLRQGIRFQDGTPFNATAVWFTFNRLLVMDGTGATGTHGSQAAWIIQQLLNKSLSTTLSGAAQPYNQKWVKQVLAQNFVKILGPYKIQINVMNPTSAFPFLIAGEWAAIVSPSWVIQHDFPKAHGNLTAYLVHQAGNGTTSLNLPQSGAKAGTGPYYIDSVNPTTYQVVLKANPNYWGGPPGYAFGRITPRIGTIQILYVPDFTTRLLDLKAGKATTIGVSPSDIFSIVDRNVYTNTGKYVSVLPGVAFYGPYPYYNTGWLNFDTNVTDASGKLLKFQPFADLRFRLAVSDAANITDILHTVANGLAEQANWMFPPGTAPDGSFVANAKTAWSYNLTKAEQLLKSAQASPITSFRFYNGTKIPPGVVDNSFGPNNPKTIPLDYQIGDSVTEKILTTVATNLNQISVNDNLGLTFSVVPIPAGTLYTLASEHQVYTYWGGWIDDYNWIVDWLGPMFSATGTYFSWNLWNVTVLNNLVNKASEADRAGNVQQLLQYSTQLGQLENQNDYYWLHEYFLYFWVGSTWVHNWFYNAEFSPNADYFAAMSFAPPASS